jgi:ABC-type lipoprotein release transport system permease subunit
VTTTLGLRFALERGSGRRAVPTRATIVGMSLAIAAIAASFTFGGSLQHLLRTPRLYGATWHLVSETEGEVPLEDARRIVRRIERNPDVLAASVAYLGVPVRLGNVIADGFALDDPSPALLPPLLQGRYPAAPDEIALGANTMRRIGVRLGARVDARFTGLPERGFRIVGVAVVPTVGHTANLGEGSLLTPAGVGRLFQGAFDTGDTASEIVVAVRPGAARAPVESFLRVVTRGSFPSVHPPLEPGDLLNFGRQRNLPFVLAAILAALAAVTLAHALVTGITRRRRDLAILKATGMRPRQARAAVAGQATALATAGILVGLPAGTAAGRWLWSAYATRLGILSEPRAPVVLLALTIPAVLVVANAIAFEPGRRAARIRPASVLRAE